MYSFFSTKTNYWLEVVFSISFCISLLSYAIYYYEFSVIEIAVSIVIGVVVWTFVEYSFHYWLFHKSSFRAFRRGHAKHHVNPKGYDAMPFFLPTLIFCLIGYIINIIVPTHLAILITATIVAGYFYYGLMHFALHQVESENLLLRRMKAYHELHHQHPNRYFGVTTSFWDFVFRTR